MDKKVWAVNFSLKNGDTVQGFVISPFEMSVEKLALKLVDNDDNTVIVSNANGGHTFIMKENIAAFSCASFAVDVSV